MVKSWQSHISQNVKKNSPDYCPVILTLVLGIMYYDNICILLFKLEVTCSVWYSVLCSFKYLHISFTFYNMDVHSQWWVHHIFVYFYFTFLYTSCHQQWLVHDFVLTQLQVVYLCFQWNLYLVSIRIILKIVGYFYD